MYPRVTVSFITHSTTNIPLSAWASVAPANVSNPGRVYGTYNNTFTGFQLSPNSSTIVSPLDGTNKLFGSTGYNGYLTKRVYTGTSIADYALITFQVNGNNLDTLSIRFDDVNYEYAPAFRLTNNQNANMIEILDNTSANVTVDVTSLGVTNGGRITLTIISWSALNRSVKVTRIVGSSSSSPTSDYYYYGSSLIDFRGSENLMDSQLNLEPGICEQYADVRLYDRNGFLHSQAQAGLLQDDAQIKLSMLGTDVEKVLGTYLVSDWNVDSNTSIIAVTCRDPSYKFKHINIDRAQIRTRTVHELLTILFSNAANLSWQYLDAGTQTRCQNIVIPDSWWLVSDLYTMLTKICAVGMLRIFWHIDKFYVGRCV